MPEKPIDPRIDEALKKCNPQKAIYALADLVDDYQGAIDRAQTTADGAQETADTALTNANAAKTESAAANAAATKAEADAANALTAANSAAADASEAAENALDAKTQAGEALRASGTATTTANEALSVAQSADTLAGQAQNRANEAYTYAGNVETALTATNVDLNNLKTATNPAIKEISPVTNTSTVNLNLTRINGGGTVAMPVASTTQAGVLNANDYRQMQDYAGRIGALEGSLAIYPVTLPSDNPSSEQITNAYTSQYPDAPNPPLDNTTVSDVTRKITYRYTSIGSTWIQVSYEVTQQFTNSSPGTIKGSTSPGMISANIDGTGSLNGYDALVATGNDSLNGLTAEGSATTISLVTTKNDGSQSVITLPQASNTSGGTISAVDYQKLQNSGVPIFTNEVLGAIKGSTEDGKINANADGTGTVNGYDALKSGVAANKVNADKAINNIVVNQGVPSIEIVADKNDGTTVNRLISPVSASQAGIVTPEMYNQWNAGGGGSKPKLLKTYWVRDATGTNQIYNDDIINCYVSLTDSSLQLWLKFTNDYRTYYILSTNADEPYVFGEIDPKYESNNMTIKSDPTWQPDSKTIYHKFDGFAINYSTKEVKYSVSGVLIGKRNTVPKTTFDSYKCALTIVEY